MKKLIRETAEEILQEYTSCYSEADEDCLVKMLENLASNMSRKIFEEIENWFELYSEREYSFAEEETSKGHCTEAEAHDYALDIIKDLRYLCVDELRKKHESGGAADD